MQAYDTMTRNVVAASLDTAVGELARLLAEHGPSAVPIVRCDAVVGIVSEGDLLRWAEGRHRATAVALAGAGGTRFQAGRGVCQDASVTPGTQLAGVPDLLEQKRIKRGPVVQDGRLVGLVSRASKALALVSRI